MAKPKMHLRYTVYMNSWPEPVEVAHCGREYVATTFDFKKVTCKLCRKKMRAS